MSDHTPAPHGTVGFVLMVVSMAIPGIMGLVSAINPNLGLVSPPGAVGWSMRLLLGGAAVLLCAGAFGFVLYRKWSWWIAVFWGGMSLIEVIRFAAESRAIVPIKFPHVVAVAFVVYVWRRRKDFSIQLGGAAT